MSDFESEFDENKLPSGLNVLTILTFVGSGFIILRSIWDYIKSSDNVIELEKLQASPDYAKIPEWGKRFVGPEMLNLLHETDINKLPILIINILGCLLCIYGAIEMRKQKINGFYVYIIGQSLPFLGLFMFIGGLFFVLGWLAYFTIGLPLFFTLLYLTQAKFLTKK